MALDPVPYRVEAAKKFGADEAVPPSEKASQVLRGMNEGRLADRIFVCTGSEIANLHALEYVERGGVVLFFAPTDPGVHIPLSINDVFFRNDITLTTSYGASPYDSRVALQLIRCQIVNVKEMITHRLPLEETERGFRLVAEARDSLKVIIKPQEKGKEKEG